MDFFTDLPEEKSFPAAFGWGAGSEWHLFSECPHPSFVHIRERPEVHDLLNMDRRTWPRCLLWHGWLPA